MCRSNLASRAKFAPVRIVDLHPVNWVFSRGGSPTSACTRKKYLDRQCRNPPCQRKGATGFV